MKQHGRPVPAGSGAVKGLFAAALFLLALVPTQSEAACTCHCVDGEMQPLCQSALDIRPYCPDLLCPFALLLVPPPISPPGLPVGAIECRQAYVCDVFGGRCRWRRVCEED